MALSDYTAQQYRELEQENAVLHTVLSKICDLVTRHICGAFATVEAENEAIINQARRIIEALGFDE